MPRGLQGTKPMPSSSHSGRTSASGPRYSMRRMVKALHPELPLRVPAGSRRRCAEANPTSIVLAGLRPAVAEDLRRASSIPES